MRAISKIFGGDESQTLKEASRRQTGFFTRMVKHGGASAAGPLGDVPEAPDDEFQEALTAYIATAETMEQISSTVQQHVTLLKEATETAVAAASAFNQPAVCHPRHKTYRMTYLRYMSSLFRSSEKIMTEECWTQVLLPIQVRMQEMKERAALIEERTKFKEEYDYYVHKVTLLTRQLIQAKHKHLGQVSRLSVLDHKLQKHHGPLIEAVDRNRDGMIDYKEYTDMLKPPRITAEPEGEGDAGDAGADGEDGDGEDDEDEDGDGLSSEQKQPLPKVDPYGAEELREDVLVSRRRRQEDLSGSMAAARGVDRRQDVMEQLLVG